MIYHINRINEKNLHDHLNRLEKIFDAIQHPFVIKALNQVGIDRNFFKLIKSIYKKSTANTILYGENLEDFPLRSGTKQACPLNHIGSPC